MQPLSSLWNRFLPVISFGIGSAALLFQTTILYPWHNTLDRDFHELRHIHESKLQEYHEIKLKKMEEINNNINQLRRELMHLEELQEKLRGQQSNNN
jgi:hypothetical protein